MRARGRHAYTRRAPERGRQEQSLKRGNWSGARRTGPSNHKARAEIRRRRCPVRRRHAYQSPLKREAGQLVTRAAGVLCHCKRRKRRASKLSVTIQAHVNIGGLDAGGILDGWVIKEGDQCWKRNGGVNGGASDVQPYQIGPEHLLRQREGQVFQHQLLRLVVGLKDFGVYTWRKVQDALRHQLRGVDLRAWGLVSIGPEGGGVAFHRKRAAHAAPRDSRPHLGAVQLLHGVGGSRQRVELKKAKRLARLYAAADERVGKQRLEAGRVRTGVGSPRCETGPSLGLP